ncbi:MAG: hypothetical protein ACLU0O_07330 [Collinsella sp.]
MALHARAFTRVAFDPFITRGEDLDYLFNMRMFGYDVWFDNEWTVRHLPPESEKRSPRFMQDVLPLVLRAGQADVRCAPGAHSGYGRIAHALSGSVDLARARRPRAQDRHGSQHVYPRARGYLRIWRHGIDEAKTYARQNAASYLRFQSFGPRSWMNFGGRTTDYCPGGGRMIDRRAQRDNSISIFRIIAVVCAVCVLVYFIFALATGIEPIATVIACALLCIFLCIFIFLTLNPDSVRSQYTEETLSVASAMLEDIRAA